MTDATNPSNPALAPVALTGIQTAEAVAQEVGAVVAAAAPFLDPKIAALIGLINVASTALAQWQATGAVPTDEQVQAIFAQYAPNKVDDLQAQADAKASGDTSGT